MSITSLKPKQKSPIKWVKGYLEGYDGGWRDGVKEVVEWMKENLYISPDKTIVEQLSGRLAKQISGIIFEEKWQAKLKEWGIKDE